MKIRDIFLGLCLGFGAAAIAAPGTTNWLDEAVTVRLPQSELVRHPIDNSKYYLCWSDGANRYGLAFRKSQLDAKMKAIPRAGRVPVAAMMMGSSSRSGSVLAPWSTTDEKICWPN